jgi:uncharacterized protein (TIGR02246 family)
MKKTLVACLLACGAVATPLRAADAAAPRHGLMTLDGAWVKAMLAGDTAAVAALYADDAVLVLPGSGAIKGRKAISDAYAGWLKDTRVTEAVLTDTHYSSAGRISTGWGAWKMTTAPKAGGKATTETGTFSAVAAQQKDGSWKYVSDHASADPAPAPAPAASASPKK